MGTGLRSRRAKDISVGRQADYLASWMGAIGLDRAILVGHDIGGGVVQNLAVRRSELAEGLVLTNSISYDSWPVPPVKAISAAGFAVERLPNAVFRRIYGAFIASRHEDRARARESFAEHWPNYEASGSAAAFVRQARSLNVRDTLAIAGAIPNLDLPARLVWGTADPYQQIGYGYRLAYELKAPITRVEGGKHFMPEDHPEEVAAAVNGLLEETAAPGGNTSS